MSWLVGAGWIATGCMTTPVDALIPEDAGGRGGLSGSAATSNGAANGGASGAVVQFDCSPRAATAEAGYARIMVSSAPLCITIETSSHDLGPSAFGARLDACRDGHRLWELIPGDELDTFEVRSAAGDLYLVLAPVDAAPGHGPGAVGEPGSRRRELNAVPRRVGREVFRFRELEMNHYVISPTSRPEQCLGERHAELALRACDPGAPEQRWTLIPGGCPTLPSE